MINLSKEKTQQGFTLIELLVVVIVISALSGVVVSMINSGGFRDKAKDAQRVADLKQIQTALELHFSDTRSYPTTGSASWIQIDGSDYLSTGVSALSPTYINKVPIDPDLTGSNDTPCFNEEEKRYNYGTNATGSGYLLTSIMAVTSSNDGNECTILNGWGATCSGGETTIAADLCYGTENP